MAQISNAVLEKYCQFFLSDVPLSHLNLNERDKLRLQVVREAYQVYMGNKMMSTQRLRAHIKNIWNRSDREVTNDLNVLNYIISRYDRINKDVIRQRSIAAVERAIDIAADKGNEEALIKGGLALYKVGECDVPDPSDPNEHDRRVLETVITDDFTKTETGRKGGYRHYDEDTVLQLQRQFGGSGNVKDLIEKEPGIFIEEQEIHTENKDNIILSYEEEEEP